MKKQLTFIILAALWALTASSQELLRSITTSSQHAIGPDVITGHQVLVRHYNGRYVLTHSRDMDALNRNRFTIRDLNSDGLAQSFTIDNGNSAFSSSTLLHEYSPGHVTFDIYDMYILDNTCYFCGSKRTTTGNAIEDMNGNTYAETSDIGIIGYFSISQMLAGHGNYHILKINNTSAVSRLVAYNSYPYIMAVASSADNAPSPTCLAALRRVASGVHDSWNLTLAHTADPSEVLTDLTTASDALVTVSRRLTDLRSLVFHITKMSGVFDMPMHLEFFNSHHVLNVDPAVVGDIFREEAEPILLAKDPEMSAIVAVHAFSGDHKGFAIYDMHFNNTDFSGSHPFMPLVMDSSQHVLSDYHLPLADFALLPRNQHRHAVLLNEASSGGQQALHFLDLAQTNNYMSNTLKLDGFDLQSVSGSDCDLVSVGASGTGFSLWNFRQHPGYSGNLTIGNTVITPYDGCFSTLPKQNVQIIPPSPLVVEYGPAWSSDRENFDNIQTDKASFETTMIPVDTPCYKYRTINQ